jgi:hypothetical protein
VWLIGLWAWPLPASPAAEPGSASEYAVKAAFLYQLAQYVEWPAANPPPAGPAEGAFVIGVLGADPFGRALDALAERKKLGGRALAVRRYKKLQDVGDCQLLFVARSEEARLEEVMARFGRLPVLLVGDSPGFAERGLHVNFFLAEERVRFEINLEASRRAGLQVSAKLLRLARLVKDKGD